jgi:Heavy-metal resistance
MKRRTVNILLFISLAFNIAFLGGGVYRFYQMRQFRPMHERIKNDKVKAFMQERKNLGEPLMRDFHEAKDNLMKALAKPGIDEAELNKLIDIMIEKQNLQEKKVGEALIDLRKELTDEEAEQVFGRFREWMRSPERFQHDRKGPKEQFRKFKQK